jgi:hypothetical protein
MDKVIRKVADIDGADRRVLEHLIGKRLAENQQLIISVVSLDVSKPDACGDENAMAVPEWWNIYEGLSDDEIDRLDQAIRQRAKLTRHFE